MQKGGLGVPLYKADWAYITAVDGGGGGNRRSWGGVWAFLGKKGGGPPLGGLLIQKRFKVKKSGKTNLVEIINLSFVRFVGGNLLFTTVWILWKKHDNPFHLMQLSLPTTSAKKKWGDPLPPLERVRGTPSLRLELFWVPFNPERGNPSLPAQLSFQTFFTKSTTSTSVRSFFRYPWNPGGLGCLDDSLQPRRRYSSVSNSRRSVLFNCWPTGVHFTPFLEAIRSPPPLWEAWVTLGVSKFF